jgi:hypothetical protein
LTDSLLQWQTEAGGYKMLCKRTYKNQITLPKRIMEDFKDVEYFQAKTERGRIILEPIKIIPLSDRPIDQVSKIIAEFGLTEKDIEEAITWARKK